MFTSHSSSFIGLICVLKKTQMDRQRFTCDQEVPATVDPFRNTMNQLRSQYWPHLNPPGRWIARVLIVVRWILRVLIVIKRLWPLLTF